MDLSDLKLYEEELKRFKNQQNERVSISKEVLLIQIDRRSGASSYLSKSSRKAQITTFSTTHSKPSNLSRYASRSPQDERWQKIEKVAAFKT